MNTKQKNKIKLILIKKYDGRCAYCGCELTLKTITIDHIKPQITGGTDDIENLNPSCNYCNNYKCFCDIEQYRVQLLTMLNNKPEYLFKSKTKMQIAINMDSVTHRQWNGKFYFEKTKEEKLHYF